MARFYGWSDSELEGMDAHTFREYLDSISILEGRESLLQMSIADYPRQSQENRDNFHRYIYIEAFPDRKKMSIGEALSKLTRGV